MRKLSILIVLMAGLLVACATPTPELTASPDPEPGDVPFTAEEDTLVIYSGRSEELVGPLIERFEEETGIDAQVRYGDTAQLAATILEEGDNTPADVFYGQDAGALGALSAAGATVSLPDDILNAVEPRFRSPDGQWVGTSGRGRVIAYNTDNLSAGDLPDSIIGFADPEWEGRIGWAPTNGSFQAFVTAFRVAEGEDATREWLTGIIANQPTVYPSNTTTLEGVASGEVDVGFINHYYLFRQLENNPDFPADIYFPPDGDIGALVNVAGTAVLQASDSQDAAIQFVEYLLSESAQEYFRDETFEYPLASGIEADPRLPPLAEIETPDIDLSALEDLEGTLNLLQDVGALE